MTASLYNPSNKDVDDWTDEVDLSRDELDELDPRNDHRPSDIVQSKLIEMMSRSMPIPVSTLHSRRFVNR